MFSGSLTSDSIQQLHGFMDGRTDEEGSLSYHIVEGLQALKKEKESLKRKIQTLKGKISKKEKETARDKNYETELTELKREKSALQALLKTMLDKNTYNYFTDEGLLPNYAFPEAGVQLKSIIYRKKENVTEAESKYETTVFDYERASASAIQELAPANFFYAGGRKVQVDQINMALSEVETWRFCTECSHMELVGKEEEKPTCPNCGNTMWSDEGQKRQMLRIKQVMATTPDRDSRIDDGSDDRQSNFFNKKMLVNFRGEDVTAAYRVDKDELPFGFEFLSKAVFREINFGETTDNADVVSIAGDSIPRKGFKVCRHCGKVQLKRKKRKK